MQRISTYFCGNSLRGNNNCLHTSWKRITCACGFMNLCILSYLVRFLTEFMPQVQSVLNKARITMITLKAAIIAGNSTSIWTHPADSHVYGHLLNESLIFMWSLFGHHYDTHLLHCYYRDLLAPQLTCAADKHGLAETQHSGQEDPQATVHDALWPLPAAALPNVHALVCSANLQHTKKRRNP